MDEKEWIVGTDVGGTFTDIIGINTKTGEQKLGKVSTTPPTYYEGIINGLKKAALSGETTRSFRHGATVSTNAVEERKGVKTALITTHGFRDVLGGGRAERISAFELDWDPPEIIIPRRNVLTVRERVSPWGEVVIPLNKDDVRVAARKCRKRGIESIAVVYMDSFMHPEHEIRTREILQEELPDVDVTISWDVRPEMLEFERTTTTVLNAYVAPIMKNYMAGLKDLLKDTWRFEGPVLITTGSGGLVGIEEAIKLPAVTFHSSPVSGAVGFAGYCGSLAGFENVIAFETGGTTNNVSMIYKGSPAMTREWKILWNVPCCLPSVDTIYMGAGGGSIGWVDKGGILNVGPQSQGAVPGPACYGAGGEEATNTDTQIVLGRINPDYFLGGEMEVYPELSFKALKEKIGDKYGWSAEEAAWNMYMVAMTNLMLGIRLQTVSRGWDPRDFAIVPYGGGGALYACDIAREVGLTYVVVPPLPGYASAFGALRVDVRHEFVKPIFTLESALDYDKINKEMDTLVERAIDTLRKEGIADKDMVIQRLADVKYWSQSTHFTVDVPEGRIKDMKKITENFLAAMKSKYGYTLPPGYVETELVNLRVIARGLVPKPEMSEAKTGGKLKDAMKPRRKVWFKDAGFVESDIYERGLIPVGATFDGPAIVEQPDTTTVIPPRSHCKVDKYGNLIISVER
ncbi:MAG: hydantoinase/oxoprolinase family protein [Deltaproteobacteria bacterium]|nr:hydantoinase/oxoprolinase family protein [Deltaproteobacteria bacterium]MBW1977549.1 hydantoinase/oxoprolinase family protein [Deltaproteobacteria bacterium]MBW2299497.1 hydantoinase/oxoprolinase family protein [Deltaproteobacteria bacterium]